MMKYMNITDGSRTYIDVMVVTYEFVLHRRLYASNTLVKQVVKVKCTHVKSLGTVFILYNITIK